MGKLTNLLRFKKEVPLKNQRTGEDLTTVWVRLLGDEDLKEAFKFARIASSKKRLALKDEKSSDLQDQIAQLIEQPVSDLVDIIVASRENVFNTEASVIVDREELPEIESVAKIPDAPTLEEQERFDALIAEQELSYNQRMDEYVKTKTTELRADLEEKSFEEICKIAAEELINIQALQEFMDELNNQKIFRGTYDDEKCQKRSFDTIEECKDANTGIREQLFAAYDSLEVNGEDIKN